MEKSASYRDLVAWQQAMQLVYLVYEITTEFPDQEKFGLISQIRRSAVSVASNIAEGQGRNSRGEFLQFLGNAKGSLHEVETQLLIAEHEHYGGDEKRQAALNQCDRVARLLNGLMSSLRPRSKASGDQNDGLEKQELETKNQEPKTQNA
jgi:four helix bundle protein